MITRRQFLGSAATAVALGALSREGYAQGGSARRFLFVHAEGGWDTLAVFAPLFSASKIDMESDAAPWTLGDLRLVDSPRRPAVRRFFERYHRECLVLDGVSVRSVNHETCQAVTLTGSTADGGIDWPTILAAEDSGGYELPNLVFGGPSFAGAQSVLVSRAEGQLQGLVNGDMLRGSYPPSRPLPAAVSRVVDRFLARRSAAMAKTYPDVVQATDLNRATLRAHRLMGRRFEVDLAPGGDLSSSARAALKALSDGVCRCASISTQFIFDTHEDNAQQSPALDGVFTVLGEIIEGLAVTPSPGGGVLRDDTVVVVVSEMARTPAYNGTGGRDHWPYTSMLLMGPGLVTGRAVGGYDDGFNGIGVDPVSGELDHARAGIKADEIGATLLALGGIDPTRYLPFAQPIRAILS